MKICQRCGRSLPDTARFCPTCGVQLDQQLGFSYSKLARKNRQKRILLVTAACLCIVSACITGGVFLMKNHSTKVYAETIASAERYLLEQDYSRAEEYYLEARRIEPRNPDPYEKLFEIYTITEQEEKAEEIREQAVQNLNQADQETFARRAEEITEEYQPVNTYEILTDLGNLDATPINIDDEIWLIQKDGKFSFLNNKGEQVSDSQSPQATFVVNWLQDQEGGRLVYPVCLAAPRETVSAKDQWPYNDSSMSHCDFIHSGPRAVYYLDENDRPRLTRQSKERLDAVQMGFEEDSNAAPVYLRRGEENYQGEYFVWNPSSDEVLGPYAETEVAGFSLLVQQTEGLDLFDVEPVTVAAVLFSPFWNRNAETGELKLYSADGDRTSTEYDRAVITDWSSIGAFQKDRYFLLDEQLETKYIGRFEAGARPIDNIAPVKTEGGWKLVRFGELTREKDYKGIMAEKQPAEDDQKEVKKENSADLRIPDEACITYQHSSGAGGWWRKLTLQPDGSFSYEYSDSNYGKDENGNMVPEKEMSVLHGRMEPHFENGKLQSLTVTELEFDKEPGSQETDEKGVRIHYLEESSEYLHAGSVLEYRPVGTPWNDFTELEQSWLIPLGQTPDQNITQPALVIEENVFVGWDG